MNEYLILWNYNRDKADLSSPTIYGYDSYKTFTLETINAELERQLKFADEPNDTSALACKHFIVVDKDKTRIFAEYDKYSKPVFTGPVYEFVAVKPTLEI